MPAKKCSYTYIKDEGHKHRLLMKIFYFSCKKYPFINTKRWKVFLQPLRKTFFTFSVNWIFENKKNTHLFQWYALSKFSYFVVCDAYSETLAYLLKCNRLQLYFHVGMGTQSPSSLKPVNNTKLSKWQYCACQTIFLLNISVPSDG